MDEKFGPGLEYLFGGRPPREDLTQIRWNGGESNDLRVGVELAGTGQLSTVLEEDAAFDSSILLEGAQSLAISEENRRQMFGRQASPIRLVVGSFDDHLMSTESRKGGGIDLAGRVVSFEDGKQVGDDADFPTW
jgi:hypothetical protein